MKDEHAMRVFNSLFYSVCLSFCFICPCFAQAPDPCANGNVSSSPSVVSEKDSQNGVPEVQIEPAVPVSQKALADVRLASMWISQAFRIPSRVPEEMFLAGYSYSDVLIALSLMDFGASLNEVLSLRQDHTWPQTADSLGLSENILPRPIKEAMLSAGTQNAKTLRFIPDVRSGLSERLRLPSFSVLIPDPVSVDRFRLNKQEVKNVREAFQNINNLTPEILSKPAGRSLKCADWVIAAVLAKYKPFPLETILVCRQGDVFEWPDIANIFSIDPTIMSQGPLAGIYAVLLKADKDAIPVAFKRSSYPNAMPCSYEFSNLQPTEEIALRWLLSLFYKEDSDEHELLEQSGLTLVEKSLVLAIARMTKTECSTILDLYQMGQSWQSIVKQYNLDLTGQDVLNFVIETQSAKPNEAVNTVKAS